MLVYPYTMALRLLLLLLLVAPAILAQRPNAVEDTDDKEDLEDENVVEIEAPVGTIQGKKVQQICQLNI